MFADNVIGDRESKAGAAVLAFGRKKRIKDMLHLVLVDAFAGIGYLNANLFAIRIVKRINFDKFAEKKVPRNYLFDSYGVLAYQTRGFDLDQMSTLRIVLDDLEEAE